MTSQLEQLKALTTVVADTGDFHLLAQFAPQDATTNPSLILKAVKQEAYSPLLAQSVRAALAADSQASLAEIADAVLVRFGLEILRLIPGRVSTEVDARLSFDTQATVARARHLMGLYEAAGASRQRVLIKIAATWEGIEAARILQSQGIHCNLTLLFSQVQARACAHAGVTLISPFVGRIYDWHKKAAGAQWDEAAQAGASDPGVQSVTRIWREYRAHGVPTQVMGASFRNVAQILALAGCDLLTISPDLLARLQASDAPLERALVAPQAQSSPLPTVNEAEFRLTLNEDAMASDKLAEGIRLFVADARQLDALIQAQLPVSEDKLGQA